MAEAQNSIDISIDRMQDAEDYAVWIGAQNEMLKREVQGHRKSARVNFAFGGVSFGVGAPLIVEGIRSDNSTMLGAGIGVAAGTGAIWAAGHFIFHWW
ncbi:MAG: hypothetical protein LBH20_09380 [Treponema sp.]|nr:hypothetical protein [Treponema sp.]